MIVNLCDRFHKLPSEVRAEDVELLRLLAIVAYSRDDKKSEELPAEPPPVISGYTLGGEVVEKPQMG